MKRYVVDDHDGKMFTLTELTDDNEAGVWRTAGVPIGDTPQEAFFKYYAKQERLMAKYMREIEILKHRIHEAEKLEYELRTTHKHLFEEVEPE